MYGSLRVHYCTFYLFSMQKSSMSLGRPAELIATSVLLYIFHFSLLRFGLDVH